MSRRYMLGCGFHATGPDDWRVGFLRDLWLPNVLKYSTPDKIIVIADSGSGIPIDHEKLIKIPLTGDLGYCGELLHGGKPGPFPTGPMVLVALAMLAYVDQCDLVYKESDLLMFGPCIDRMYHEIGDGGIIFGHARVMPCANSLFLLKHAAIPRFVAHYMASQPEVQAHNIAETKFQRWHQADPNFWRKFSFGVDRDRPIPYDADCFYCQKIQPDEMAELRTRGLI